MKKDIPLLWKEYPSSNQEFLLKLLLLQYFLASSAKAMFDFPKFTCSSVLSGGKTGGSGLGGLYGNRAITVSGLRWSLQAGTKGRGHSGSTHRASPQAIALSSGLIK